MSFYYRALQPLLYELQPLRCNISHTMDMLVKISYCILFIYFNVRNLFTNIFIIVSRNIYLETYYMDNV